MTAQVLLEQFSAIASLRELRVLSLTAYCRNTGATYAGMHEAVQALTPQALPHLSSLHLAPVSAATVGVLAQLTQLASLRLDTVPTHALLELSGLQVRRGCIW